ncbi:peptide ABC transporter substrate-binding protein [Pseudoroseomonas deserti]|uniref:Peptide ABC transporter substrate-binding protein n=1 Tax=Teichococcus deserti TaxID=1817963 RepID=A0A1V2H1F1_9PROT|nr:ABC transporter substrate-binding protein [Pseudoroseomonas deserti]ONG52323.1 peptide ABC transporter substrate-binding protein [Pseudoroseomonas deserti]
MLLPVSRRLALSGLAGLPLLALRPSFAQETPRRGGVLKYATLGLDTADPHRHTGALGVQQAFVEGLTSIATNGSVEPFLAESFEVSPDGKLYTFRIRQGVRFHNGDLLTAADVVANMERVKTKVRGGWLTSAMRGAESMVATDASTVQLRLKQPFAPLLNLVSELWILSPKSPGWDATITQPIGTGPFTFGEWQPKTVFRAPAFEGYWQQGRPYLSAVEFDLREVADPGLALRAGDLHVASVTRDKLRPLLRDATMKPQPIQDTTWYFAAFNNRKPSAPMDDARVRQAIGHAIDKRAVMNFVAGRDAIVTNQMVIPGNVYFDQATHDADIYAKPDLDRARALLREAGVDPTKRKLEVISWQSAYPQTIVQMIKRLGFEVNHVALDDVGAQRRLGQYDWDIALFESGPRADIFLRYVRLTSDGPNPVLWGGIQDEALDTLIDKAVAEPDQPKRVANYLAAWKHVMARDYFYVLGHEQSVIVNRAEVQGWQPGFTWSPHWASGGLAQAWLKA